MTRAKHTPVNQRSDDPEAIIRNYNLMNNNIRIVPIQKVCLLCTDELPQRDTAKGLARRLCQACIQLLQEQMIIREVRQHPKMPAVRVQ